jgi:pimeloyl-ACP methyl ester carboxylesterase/glycine cleavage system regulatory protein
MSTRFTRRKLARPAVVRTVGVVAVGGGLTIKRVDVDGRRATYAVGGDGPPVLFLHGWALGNRSYRRIAQRLARRGCRVYAPTMPGFAGTAKLPGDAMSIGGYADWVDAFMAAVGIDEPALVIGHSFGGGISIKLAHAHPERVGYLVLLNSVGGVTDRPILEWIWSFSIELLPTRQGIDIWRAMRDDLATNIVRNPGNLVRAALLAKRADLRTELAELRARDLPVLALTAQDDGIIPLDAFEALCAAVGADGQVLGGRHFWMIVSPDSFDEVLGNVVEVRNADHRAAAATGRVDLVLDALKDTSIPSRRARTLVRDAPPLWLMSAPPETLATDLALCHPKLEKDEVRAVAQPIAGGDNVRLTVAATDRRGLLADTTSVLARHGLSIANASAATWAKPNLALHAFTIEGAAHLDQLRWERIGEDLREMVTIGFGPEPTFVRYDRARVTVDSNETEQALIRVSTRDQVGLLWKICRWLADRDLNIECVHAETENGIARDVFVVSGQVDAADLRQHLAGPPPSCFDVIGRLRRLRLA